ncbi:hypothetical protein PMIN06_000412 [Paraphaeosphaeria minitans]
MLLHLRQLPTPLAIVDCDQLHVVFHDHDQLNDLRSKLDCFNLDDLQLDDRRSKHEFLKSDNVQLYFAYHELDELQQHHHGVVDLEHRYYVQHHQHRGSKDDV